MAITRLSGVNTQAYADGTVTTSALNTTGADLILIAVKASAGGSYSVSDNKSNTWTLVGTATNLDSNLVHRLYYLQPTGAGAGSGHTFTLTQQGESGIYAHISVVAYSGAAATAVLNQSSFVDIGYTSSVTTPSITPTTNNQLVFFSCGMAGVNVSSSSPYATIQSAASGAGVAEVIQTTAGAVTNTFTLTGGGNTTAFAASFKEAASGAAFIAKQGLNIRQAINRASTF